MITKPVKPRIPFTGIQKVAGPTKKAALSKAIDQVRKTLNDLHLVAYQQTMGRVK